MNRSAKTCLLKMAECAAQLENYQKAIEIYEEFASASLDNWIHWNRAMEYFFRAALCHLCIDPFTPVHLLHAQHALQQYEDIYPAFQVSKEKFS